MRTAAISAQHRVNCAAGGNRCTSGGGGSAASGRRLFRQQLIARERHSLHLMYHYNRMHELLKEPVLVDAVDFEGEGVGYCLIIPP